MSSVILAGDTSGSITLAAPAVAGSSVLTMPVATDTLVGKATTDTLTNKTLTGAVMNGTVGATTPAAGAFTTLSASGATTLSTTLVVTSASNSLGVVINGRSSDNLGAMYFYANDGTTNYATITASATEFRSSAVPAASVQTFYTNGSERMRINAAGDLRLGSLAISQGNSDAKATIYGGATNSSPCIEFYKGSTTNTTSQVFARFQISQDTTAVASGSITANGASAVGFTAWSDRRLKENITDLPSQLANLMALRPVEFDYIESMGGGHQIGFVAQEVQSIYPDLVGEDVGGMLALTDMNKNDARLIKAIQEMKAIIDTQADTITALTDRLTALEVK